MPVYTKKSGLIYCVYYSNGKRIWESFGRDPDAQKAAEARDLEIKFKKKKGQWRSDSYPSSLTFHDLTQFYIDTRKTELSENTKDGILRAVATYALPYIGKKPINRITMSDWWKIQDKMIRRNVSNTTINTYFVYLSRILSWAIEENEDLLDEHPWRKRKRLKIHKKFRVDLFSMAEFRRILKKSQPHLAWCLEVAYYTGVRPGPTELFNLKWSDIDWKRKRIRIYSPKTDSYRWQYPEKDLMEKLRSKHKESIKEYPDCPWICSYKGKQLTTIKRIWKAAKEKAKIKRRIRLYDIRHFYITYALASGADIMELAERVGHVNGEMIMRVYAHLAKDLQKNKPLKIPSLY